MIILAKDFCCYILKEQSNGYTKQNYTVLTYALKKYAFIKKIFRLLQD